ncbi:hypothetical protein QQ054_36325 [Oscillatoria amoena NRMC-F 0135]|nr:hypothetical protein [Oscillatoria amoena NRMC-F 0135]
MPHVKKNDTPASTVPNPDIRINIIYVIDKLPLEMDTVKYTNAAGNNYSVSRLEYYLSGFSFMDASGKWWDAGNEFYVNAKTSNTNSFSLRGLPLNNYSRVKFFIGISTDKNKTNALAPTPENINMVWPDMMGGGYHFLKLEGYFKDTAAKKQGFAMHLGNSKNLVTVETPIAYNHNGNDTLNLQMNINEWFATPNTYNFNIQGNYTMGVDSLMTKLKQNGADVFKIVP